MPKLFFLFSAISGLLAVGLGAFGAHALKAKLEASGLMQAYQTAVQYQFYHTLALLAVGLLLLQRPSEWLNYAGYGFMAGTLIFSGSLYVMCFTGMRWLGAITPIGGLALILGWACLVVAVMKLF